MCVYMVLGARWGDKMYKTPLRRSLRPKSTFPVMAKKKKKKDYKQEMLSVWVGWECSPEPWQRDPKSSQESGARNPGLKMFPQIKYNRGWISSWKSKKPVTETHITWFYQYEMTRTGQARGGESEALVRGWEGGIWDEVETRGVSLGRGGHRNVLQLDRDSGHTNLWLY